MDLPLILENKIANLLNSIYFTTKSRTNQIDNKQKQTAITNKKILKIYVDSELTYFFDIDEFNRRYNISNEKSKSLIKSDNVLIIIPSGEIIPAKAILSA